jgi:hypothetical protein
MDDIPILRNLIAICLIELSCLETIDSLPIWCNVVNISLRAMESLFLTSKAPILSRILPDFKEADSIPWAPAAEPTWLMPLVTDNFIDKFLKTLAVLLIL